MSSLAAAVSPDALRRRVRSLPLLRLRVAPTLTTGVAVLILLCAFVAQGGSKLERTTWIEVGLMLAGAAACAAALVLPRTPATLAGLHGAWVVLAYAALAAWTALSVIWSLAPADSWLEADLALAYLATLAGALALSRLAPGHWAAVLEGVVFGTVLVCAWALATKVFPAALAPDEPFARLRPPFEYWNAVGLVAASSVPGLLWLAARRSGHHAVNAIAWPALGLALVTLMLSYSRGSLLALGLGLAAFFAVVPLRLRALTALVGAGVAAAPVVAWAFTQDGLTVDQPPMGARADAGRALGALLLMLVAALIVAGLAVGFLSARHPPSRRTRVMAGRAVVGALTLVPLVALVALASAPGGVDGQVSKAWKRATDPGAPPPGNTPKRLTATASVRARYWREAIDIHALSPVVGSGAGSFATVRKRFRRSALDVRHAHSYPLQALSDLGWIGLGLSVVAAALWVLAAARTLGLRRGDRGLPWDAERVGLATMATIVLVIGVHGAIDWTWSVPGCAVIALLCGGWVAGRGPLRARLASPATAEPASAQPPADARSRRLGRVPLPRWTPAPERAAAAALVLAIAVVAAWTALQPVRSVHAQDAALERLGRGAPEAAASIARIAHERNPLTVTPLFDLGAIEIARRNRTGARQAFRGAVRLQPANPETWRALGRFELNVQNDPRAALRDFKVAYFLDPASFASISDIVQASRRLRAPR